MIKFVFTVFFVLTGSVIVLSLSCIMIAALALTARKFFRRTLERLKGKR